MDSNGEIITGFVESNILVFQAKANTLKFSFRGFASR